jgi:hypothetical protein
VTFEKTEAGYTLTSSLLLLLKISLTGTLPYTQRKGMVTQSSQEESEHTGLAKPPSKFITFGLHLLSPLPINLSKKHSQPYPLESSSLKAPQCHMVLMLYTFP